MNVDLVRAFEAEPVESPRDRKAGKGSGFSALMDSVLGARAEERGDARDSANARRGEATRDRAPRESSSAPQKPARGERSERASRGEARKEEVASAEAAPTSKPVRGEKEERAAETAVEAASEAEQAAAEAIVAPDAPAWEVAAPIAAAVLELLARAETGVEIDSAEGVVDDVGAAAPAVADLDDAAFAARMGALAPAPEQDLAEGTNGRMGIADPAARKEILAALADVDADTGADAESGGAAETIEVEVMPAAAAANEALERAPVGERDLSIAMRPAPRADESRRSEAEGVDVRADGIPQEAARPQGELGSDGFARDRRGDGRQAVLTPVEQTAGDSKSASPSTATAAAQEAAPTPQLPETALRPDDVSGQARIDAPTAAAPVRAPELPSALQTGRPSPTTAPDAIAIQADWLATRGGGTARLVLSPPELGEIAIRVTVRQQSVEVVMVAQTALAHSIAEDQGDRLSQAFAHRDLRLDQFEVRRGDPSDSSGTGQFGSSDAGARERERAEDDRGFEQAGVAGRGTRRRSAGGEGAIAPPRVVSTGRPAGVDLRI